MEPMRKVTVDEVHEVVISPAEKKRASKVWSLYLVVFVAFVFFKITEAHPWLTWVALFGGPVIVGGLHLLFVVLKKPTN